MTGVAVGARDWHRLGPVAQSREGWLRGNPSPPPCGGRAMVLGQTASHDPAVAAGRRRLRWTRAPSRVVAPRASLTWRLPQKSMTLSMTRGGPPASTGGSSASSPTYRREKYHSAAEAVVAPTNNALATAVCSAVASGCNARTCVGSGGVLGERRAALGSGGWRPAASQPCRRGPQHYQVCMCMGRWHGSGNSLPPPSLPVFHPQTDSPNAAGSVGAALWQRLPPSGPPWRARGA